MCNVSWLCLKRYASPQSVAKCFIHTCASTDGTAFDRLNWVCGIARVMKEVHGILEADLVPKCTHAVCSIIAVGPGSTVIAMSGSDHICQHRARAESQLVHLVADQLACTGNLPRFMDPPPLDTFGSADSCAAISCIIPSCTFGLRRSRSSSIPHNAIRKAASEHRLHHTVGHLSALSPARGAQLQHAAVRPSCRLSK